MIDKDFELQGETAERPEPKKLTAADIPECFNYAAVDASGNTVAYYEQPFLAPGDFEWSCYTNDFKPIGVFDATDWQNSLVKRETAERPPLKKLTAADIPEGFRYAAVDKDGITYAYWECPFIEDYSDDWSSHGYHYKQIGSFDASDWQNSLVKRETAERPEGKGIKEIENKPSFVELDPDFMEAMAWRMTTNKGKYPANNWKRQHNINDFLDAIQRHLNDIRRQRETGQSQTGESIKAHCAAIACNAMFLHYHTVELNELMRAVYSRKSNAKEI